MIIMDMKLENTLIHRGDDQTQYEIVEGNESEFIISIYCDSFFECDSSDNNKEPDGNHDET